MIMVEGLKGLKGKFSKSHHISYSGLICHNPLKAAVEHFTKNQKALDNSIIEIDRCSTTSKTKVLQLPAAGVWHGSEKTAKF